MCLRQEQLCFLTFSGVSSKSQCLLGVLHGAFSWARRRLEARARIFKFFSINSDNNSEIWMENWPGPHFTTKTEEMAGKDFDLSQTELGHEDLPPALFVVEDLFAPLGVTLTKDRASARCVDLDASCHSPSDSQHANSSLLVGTSHVKNKEKIESCSDTTKGHICMSRFHAF
jgi:hypothetical protein